MNNPVLDAIHNRRSVRGYTDEFLTNEQIATLANAALAAPSAMNRQPYQIIAVKDKALLLEIEKAAVDYFVERGDEAMIERNKSRGNKVFYNAPAVFFIAADEGGFAHIDAGIAVQNIALAAKSMGLDSIILGMPRYAFSGKKGEELAARLKFPEGYKLAIAIAVGHADQDGKPHELSPAKLTLIG